MKNNPNKNRVGENRISKNRITKIIIIKTLICFMFVTAILVGIRYMMYMNNIKNQKIKAEDTATIAFDRISVKMEIIEEELKSIIDFSIDSQGNVSNFDDVAQTIINSNSVSCVVLAPKGIVQYVYPNNAQNEYLKGYNYNADSNDIQKIGSITDDEDEKVSGLCGPYLYKNGKTYLVVRVPVFRKSDSSQIWGFACALINFPEAFMNSGIDLLTAQKYLYNFYRYGPEHQEISVLSSYKRKIQNGVIVQRQILNHTWNIIIVPEEGWYNKNQLAFEVFIVIVISILISIIIFDYLRLKDTGRTLTRIVNVDMLTGAFSRKYFFDYAQAEIQRNKRFGICYIDVDKFKQVNDTYGHEVGDKFLLEVTNRIREYIRKNDFVSRIGGDEFVIFMNDINEEFDGEAILKRFKTSMEEPFIIKNNIILNNTLSIGYSVFPEDGSTVEELIQKADYHMYHMKKKTHREIHINHLIKQNKINYPKKNDNK